MPAMTTAPGRNDPWWCGSSKKYKKCHLAEDEKREADRHGPVPAQSEYFDPIQGRWRDGRAEEVGLYRR